MTRERIKLSLAENSTSRAYNPGAEKMLGEVIPVLDLGFVYLVDYMGNDQSIVQAARVSYGAGTKATSEDRGLIRYLMRNRHTTPFEMGELKFHAKMPYFVAAQWVRHRTASINAESARYSIMKEEFYVPDMSAISVQSKDNKQGRGELLPIEESEQLRYELQQRGLSAFEYYHHLLNQDMEGNVIDKNRQGIAKELARTVLPESTYTQWYWKIDLHNLFHFLGLRMDPHAQLEIRQYAEAISEIVKEAFPFAYEAFEDYVLESKIITGPEMDILANLFESKGMQMTIEEIAATADSVGLKNKREREEMIDKFRAMGLIRKINIV
ncbi:MAG: FAD-dependent thymidylate synthase [Patescibacteria group bacterium]